MIIERIHGYFPIAEATLTNGRRICMREGHQLLLTSMPDGRLCFGFQHVFLGRLFSMLLYVLLKVVGFLTRSSPKIEQHAVALFRFGPGFPVAGVRLVTPQMFELTFRGRMIAAGVSLMEPVADLFQFNALVESFKPPVLQDEPAIEAIARGLSDSAGE